MTICTVHGFFSRCCSLKLTHYSCPNRLVRPSGEVSPKGHCTRIVCSTKGLGKGKKDLCCCCADLLMASPMCGKSTVEVVKKKENKLKDQFEKPAQLATASLCGNIKCAVKLSRTLPGSSHICAAYEIDVTFE